MFRSSLMSTALQTSRQRWRLFVDLDRVPTPRHASITSVASITKSVVSVKEGEFERCKQSEQSIHARPSIGYGTGPDSRAPTVFRSPADELCLIREMLEALERTNSKVEKEEILHRFGSLKQLLLFLFDRRVRMHVRPQTLKSYLVKDDLTSAVQDEGNELDVSLLDVFRQLSDRQKTGHDALRFLSAYLSVHEILAISATEHKQNVKVTLLDVFLRCLDRNLKVGVKDHIVRSAFQASSEAQQSHEDSFSVSLGKPIEEDEVESLLSEQDDAEKTWFVSRKLDGVRCIIRVDLVQATATTVSGWRVVDMQTLSRTGRPFLTLQNLTDPFKVHVEQSEAVKAILERADQLGQDLSPRTSDERAGRTARLYFDGEVCKLARASVEEDVDEEVRFVEDFQAIVGPIKRKNFTVLKPAYFPFDILTFSEFHQWRTHFETHDPFHLRLLRVEQFVRGCARGDEDVVRHLEQMPVRSLEDVRRWMLRAAKDGWEGLILRQGGRYEGKRTSSIRKLKHFYEDEYVVQDVELAQMRLPVGQKYAERTALASAVILHKGTPVHVGSGFNVEQRIRFAQRPESLIGKQITVAYFGESRSAARVGAEEVSLRFPRVKAIWEDGVRDV